ncbi:MAG: YopX protein [Clostridiaceae bacterium]|jgi:hypothetical protein|nr:YopX protein [Clostridiaceae bacterium]
MNEKYKIWDNGNEKWMTSNCGRFLIDQQSKLWFNEQLPQSDYRLEEVFNYEIVWSIGINDTKTGADIYQGDYIEVIAYGYEEPENKWEGIVVKSNLGWCIDGINSVGERRLYSLSEIVGSLTSSYEILDSIYENPELKSDFQNNNLFEIKQKSLKDRQVYLVLAYLKDRSYPSFVSDFKDGYMIQGNLYDATKFQLPDDATQCINNLKSLKDYENWSFDVGHISLNIFGNNPRFVRESV